MARMLERLLATRVLTIINELRKRLATCEDENLLRRWFDGAVAATSLTEVFDD